MKALIPDELKRAFLRKVVESSTFARSEQLRRLLDWLGEKAIGGVTPSEYDVGTGPLLRPRNFEPQADSLVRKEMTRLRDKLKAYYAKEGRADTVCLRCEDAYRVAFQWSSLEPWFRRGDAICVMLLPLRASGASADFIEEIYDRLLLSVSETRQIQLIAPTTARFYAGRSGDIRTFASETGADFVVEGSVWVRGEVVGTTLWPVDGQTGRSLPPCNLIGSNVDELSARAAECLVLRLTGGNVTSSATPA